MDNQIKMVRKGIKQRKHLRTAGTKAQIDYLPYLATDEEKHGISSSSNLDDTMITPKKQTTFTHHFTKKIIGSLLLFIIMIGILQLNVSFLAIPKYWLEISFQEEFPFAKMSEKYIELFGMPLAFTPEDSEKDIAIDQEINFPIPGDVVETFTDNGQGIMISAEETTDVTAFDRGTVIFAGNDRQTDKTVIVQHTDNSKTIYGHLSTIDVFLYEFVQANEKLGTYEPSTNVENVYFSIKKEQEYIDPVEVIMHVDAP